MPLYEHVYLARQDVSAQQVEDLTDVEKRLVALGGRDPHERQTSSCPEKYTNRYLPIWTSSLSVSDTVSIRLRLT